MKYKVSVEKRMYCTGVIEVDCKSSKQAMSLVQKQIDKGTLQTSSVEWNPPEYEDSSFDVTGDVD